MNATHAAPLTTINPAPCDGVPGGAFPGCDGVIDPGQIIGRLTSREDIAEILRMAKLERTRAISNNDREGLTRARGIVKAAREALDTASARLQLPRDGQGVLGREPARSAA